MRAFRVMSLWTVWLCIGLVLGQQGAHAASEHANIIHGYEGAIHIQAEAEPAVGGPAPSGAAVAQLWALPTAAKPQEHTVHGMNMESSSSSSSVLRRRLQQHPGSSERDREAEEARKQHLSAGHVMLVMLMCVVSLAVLGFIGWRAVAWYQNLQRPGYVELQSMETYHRPRWMPAL